MTSPGRTREVAVRPLPLAPVWPRLPVAALASPLGACQESCGLYLHMELVQMLLGSEPNPSTAQLQHAGRKLEAVGFHVGERLVERYTKERPRFSDTLEIIKFICKDFWMEVYRKQIDKLQTNNRGVYMLQDNTHPILQRCSPPESRQANAKQLAALHIKFPSGLIRGALSGLGVVASVSAEVSEVPKCQFTIKIQPSGDKA